MAYKILIVDDETMLTELLSSHLQKCGYTAFVAEDAEQAISMLNTYPDLILLDINMPEMDGLELCKIIRNHVTCPILFLTARITEQDKVNGLQAGGDDYITKPFSLQELTARVAAHLRREARGKYMPKIVSSQGLIVNLAERKIFYGEMEMNLSNREFDIVEFLTSNANQIFDKERIYEAVWGFNAEGNSGVIKEHIRKIRNKLKEATGREYIETVWGMGYRWKK
ncbi:MAG: response regulator transcription factor [Lachnospiraceae bacterium]|nr:response regulator transcription factor [Lachnospiraceae bacterium]